MPRILRRWTVRPGLSVLFGSLLAACTSMPPVSYSVEDSEIFVAPRPHFFTVAVAVLEDRRPPEEVAWAAQRNLQSNLSEIVTERMVRHLRVSSVFSRVQAVSEPFDPTSLDRIRDLVSQGADVVLVGELVHFYGRTEPDRRIKGHVQFANLKLYGTRTGRILWQGTADKLLQRQESSPVRDDFYASEALRGAINQLAIQLDGLTFSHAQIYPSELTEIRHWRVGVLLPEDLRPPEEKDSGVRKLQGDPNYPLYTDTVLTAPLIDEVPEQWVNKLQAADIFEEVLSIKSRGGSSEELREWSDEGVDAVLASRLTHSFALVNPLYNEKPFPIWSGGMGYPRLFKATGLTRIEDVQLIETRSGRVLWSGEAEYGIDRTVKKWKSPTNLVQKSLSETLNRLVNHLSEFVFSPKEKPSSPDGPKDLPRP